MWTVDRAALVFCIDQVEDLRFFDNAEERFQRAVRDLIQIANRLTNAIIIISCLEDFYGQVRGVLAQSYIDRIEKSGPVLLLESRTPEEARLIISKRLEHRRRPRAAALSFPMRRPVLRSAVLRGVRRPFDAAPAGARADANCAEATATDGRRAAGDKPSFISTLAAGARPSRWHSNVEDDAPVPSPPFEYREMWERFANARSGNASDDHD
jgi:hypothetical protein